jgi:type II secretory pathway pseudopilin PulG
MGEDLSTKSLIVIVVITLLVSFAATYAYYSKFSDKMTAAATTTQGKARLNITTRASINFTIYMVDWGSGYVNDSASYCQLNTEGMNNPNNCTNFTTVYEGLRLENDGNRNVEVNVSSNNTAAQFIGGTNPVYEWKFLNNESDSCASKGTGNACVTNVSALQPQAYSTVSTSPALVCPCFRAQNPSDLLNLELQIRVPSDSFTGLRESTITAVGTAI